VSEIERARAKRAIGATIVALILIVATPYIIKYVTGIDIYNPPEGLEFLKDPISKLFTLGQFIAASIAAFALIYHAIKLKTAE